MNNHLEEGQATPAALGARHLFVQVEHPESSLTSPPFNWVGLTLRHPDQACWRHSPQGWRFFLYFSLSFAPYYGA